MSVGAGNQDSWVVSRSAVLFADSLLGRCFQDIEDL